MAINRPGEEVRRRVSSAVRALQTVACVAIALALNGCTNKENSVSTHSGVTFRYSEMMDQASSLKDSGAADLVVVKVRLVSAVDPELHTPSVGHEESVAVFEVVGGQVPAHPQCEKFRILYGPGTIEGKLRLGLIEGLVFHRSGAFVRFAEKAIQNPMPLPKGMEDAFPSPPKD